MDKNVENPKGNKRPVLPGPDGRMTPVPWIGGDFPFEGTWKGINGKRANEAEGFHLCIICGLHRGDDWVYALLNGEPADEGTPVSSIFGGPPSPTYGHPECILKAVLFCPHLKKQEYPAMTQDKKTKLTTDDLKKIVKEKKSLEMGIATYGRERVKAKS